MAGAVNAVDSLRRGAKVSLTVANFPKHKKEGGRIGEVIGAAIARVRR